MASLLLQQANTQERSDRRSPCRRRGGAGYAATQVLLHTRTTTLPCRRRGGAGYAATQVLLHCSLSSVTWQKPRDAANCNRGPPQLRRHHAEKPDQVPRAESPCDSCVCNSHACCSHSASRASRPSKQPCRFQWSTYRTNDTTPGQLSDGPPHATSTAIHQVSRSMWHVKGRSNTVRFYERQLRHALELDQQPRRW